MISVNGRTDQDGLTAITDILTVASLTGEGAEDTDYVLNTYSVAAINAKVNLVLSNILTTGFSPDSYLLTISSESDGMISWTLALDYSA